MTHHTVPLKTYFVIFGVLLLLLLATVGVAEINLGSLNTELALAIAVTKALLILLYFMHVKYSDRLTWCFAFAAFLWLGVLMALCMSDYLTRGWLGIEGK